MVARALLALVAVLVLAWVVVLLRDFEIGNDAAAAAFSPGLTPAERDHKLDQVKQAQFLNPDSDLRLSRAGFALLSGHPGDAARMAREIVRDEPDNIGAWGVLLEATAKSDRTTAAEANAQLKRLDPLGSR